MGLLNVLVVLIMFVAGVIIYFKWKYTYWKKRNLPYLEPCFPFGTMENPLCRTKSLGLWIKSNYDEFKVREHKHGGIYNFASPTYLPIAPEYIKNVMHKDFQHFVDRAFYYNEKDDPLSAHLFALGGQKWRNLRSKLTPAFAPGKMKMMFDILVQCSAPMEDIMEKLSEGKQAVDIKDVVTRFTTDVIVSCAFGLDCNSFKSPDPEFRKYGKKIFHQPKLKTIASLVFLSRPKLGHFLKMRVIPKDVSDFLQNVIRDTVEYRETSQVVRNDMLQILIDIKNKGSNGVDKHDGTTLTIKEIAAQAFVFFAGGFETASTTMSYCFYELASNQQIQKKVRNEIKHVLGKHGGKITYESIMDMHFMTQVVEETLRKYPPVPQLNRKCVQDYRVPNTDVVIEKGTTVFISTFGLHHDPEYYPNPEKFDPDRFTKENKERIRPFTYIPFGEGPRICIAKRFGMTQIKVGLAVLIQNFKFAVNCNTKLPLEIDPYVNILATKDIIWLDVQKVNNNEVK